jgi:hypothetical protein
MAPPLGTPPRRFGLTRLCHKVNQVRSMLAPIVAGAALASRLKAKARLKYLDERYLCDTRLATVPVAICLCIFALTLSYIGDFIGSLIIFGLCANLFARYALTEFRVHRGLLGTAPDEALEFIHFILRRAQEDGRPPASRVSQLRAVEADAAQAADAALPEAAR